MRLIIKSIPLSYRRKLGVEARKKSIEAQKDKVDIMDVVESDVIRQMRKHQVSVLIHGHTHRPNIHSIKGSNGRQVVLGDWYDQGSILEVTADSINLKVLKHYIAADTDMP